MTWSWDAVLSPNFTMDLWQNILESQKLQHKFNGNIIGPECEVLFEIISMNVEYANNSNTFIDGIPQV